MKGGSAFTGRSSLRLGFDGRIWGKGAKLVEVEERVGARIESVKGEEAGKVRGGRWGWMYQDGEEDDEAVADCHQKNGVNR